MLRKWLIPFVKPKQNDTLKQSKQVKTESVQKRNKNIQQVVLVDRQLFWEENGTNNALVSITAKWQREMKHRDLYFNGASWTFNPRKLFVTPEPCGEN